ncbi:drug/metabolite transporter superfamily protein YnfA [Actinokineospora baliensis]|uniref:hypothetical protein n=1 Tax=Actinokineospora baliensis TaxID=547056 RepID=UPI0019598785|nr:hypothetical protein [Actinokineospora baliensis]MBM7775467.1 drug/metabolite transporter superfamily protein YnfA [Actinokineospora baliensis]
MTRQLKLLIAGLACALVPYLFFVGITETRKVNGQVVVDESLNIGGVIAGIGAIAIAWAMAMKWETEADKAPHWRVAAAVIALLGALQVVVSLDLLG